MKRTDSKLIIADADYNQLLALIQSFQTETAELLAEELGRAQITPLDEMPKDVVRMNTTVEFIDLETNKKSAVTLVYPHEVNLEENKISILAPMGAALIGLSKGQEIAWPLPSGKTRKIQVLSVS